MNPNQGGDQVGGPPPFPQCQAHTHKKTQEKTEIRVTIVGYYSLKKIAVVTESMFMTFLIQTFTINANVYNTN